MSRLAGIPLSALDVVPQRAGGTTADALQEALAYGRELDRLGFQRLWLAEHHNLSGVASAATAVLMGQIAAATRRLRVGAGGIMPPNHAPLVVADEGLTMLPTGCAPVKSWPDWAHARAVPSQAWPRRGQPQACCDCSFELN